MSILHKFFLLQLSTQDCLPERKEPWNLELCKLFFQLTSRNIQFLQVKILRLQLRQSCNFIVAVSTAIVGTLLAAFL